MISILGGGEEPVDSGRGGLQMDAYERMIHPAVERERERGMFKYTTVP